jgi:hypothetical protein
VFARLYTSIEELVVLVDLMVETILEIFEFSTVTEMTGTNEKAIAE